MANEAANQRFGDPSDFAIDAGVDAITTTVWGHACVWCRGVQLGDIESLHCGMFGVLQGFRDIVERSDQLWDEAFDGLDDDTLWDLLDWHLYGCRNGEVSDEPRSIAESYASALRFRRFDFLTNWDEMFDGWKAFLILPPDGDFKILYRGDKAKTGVGVICSRSGLLKAAEDFVRWADLMDQKALANRLQP